MLSQVLLMHRSHSIGLLMLWLEALPLCAVRPLNFAVQDGWLLLVIGLFLLCPDVVALLINSTIALHHLAFFKLAMHAVLSVLMPAVDEGMTSALPHKD